MRSWLTLAMAATIWLTVGVSIVPAAAEEEDLSQSIEQILGQLDVEDGFTCCKKVSTSYIGESKFENAYTLMRSDKFEFIIK